MKYFWIILVFSLLVTAAAPAGDAPVKLAIVPETTAAGTAADLLTAEFSKNSQVQLLERAEIDKVFQEQSLSAGNRDYLKLGQLLGADGLLLLSTGPAEGKDSLNARLVAVKPGVVLMVEKFSLSASDLPKWSAAYVGHLAAIPAQAGGTGQGRGADFRGEHAVGGKLRGGSGDRTGAESADH
jgi:hypothetical protein